MSHASTKRFNLAHSIAGVSLLLAIEALVGILSDMFFQTGSAGGGVILIISISGGLGIILIATEVIREVRNSFHMLSLLSAVVGEFIVFFAFQYGYLGITAPGSFHSLALDPISLLLHSAMVFVFNPMYVPVTGIGRALLLINTIESLGLVLFVLQNVWQFRSGSTASEGEPK